MDDGDPVLCRLFSVPAHTDAQVVGVVANSLQVAQPLDKNDIRFRLTDSFFYSLNVFLTRIQIQFVKRFLQIARLRCPIVVAVA